MCTTTETIEETQEVVEPRDINVLLSLNTYQGMSDEEIEMIFSYKLARQRSSDEFIANQTALIERMEQEIYDNRLSSQRALDMIESLMKMEFPTVENVQPKLFVPSVSEV